MKDFARSAAATAVMVAGLTCVGLVAADEAQAAPGPFPQWCPGDSWDPTWGPNSDWNRCHANPVVPQPNPVYRDTILAITARRAGMVTPVDRVGPAEARPVVDLVDPADPAAAHPAADPAEADLAAGPVEVHPAEADWRRTRRWRIRRRRGRIRRRG